MLNHGSQIGVEKQTADRVTRTHVASDNSLRITQKMFIYIILVLLLWRSHSWWLFIDTILPMRFTVDQGFNSTPDMGKSSDRSTIRPTVRL